MIFDWNAPRHAATLLSLAVRVCAVEMPFALIDGKTGAELRRGAEARQHAVRCNFCRRAVAQVPKRKGRATSWSDLLSVAICRHITPCGVDALRDVLCRWSIGETSATCDSMLRDYVQAKQREDLYMRGVVQTLDGLLPVLPRPPGDLLVRCLETGLALWARGESVDWATIEPL